MERRLDAAQFGDAAIVCAGVLVVAEEAFAAAPAAGTAVLHCAEIPIIARLSDNGGVLAAPRGADILRTGVAVVTAKVAVAGADHAATDATASVASVPFGAGVAVGARRAVGLARTTGY